MDSGKEKLRVSYDTEIKQLFLNNRTYPEESAACYGMGPVIKQIAFLPDFFPLPIASDHGPSQRDEPTLLEYQTKAEMIFYHSQRLTEVWKKNSSKKVDIIYSPFVYYRRYIRKKEINKKGGTIFFPAHSTDLIESEYNFKDLIQQLKDLPDFYKPVDVCIYYRDIELGRHNKFIDFGFKVYCAGHIYDEKFMENFYDILDDYDFVVSNTIGSYTFYSVEAGKPFFLIGNKVEYNNIKNDPNCREGVYDPYKLYKQMNKGYNLFKTEYSKKVELTQEQVEYVEAELGLKDFNRFKFCFNIYLCAFSYVKKNALMKIVNKVRKIISYQKKIVFRNKFETELSVFTHLTFDEKYLLYRVAAKLPPKAVAVEIGSYLGASSCFIAAGLSQDSRLYCIDTWGNQNMKYDEKDTDADERDTFQEFITNTGKYKEKIIGIRKWSTEAIEDIKMAENEIHLLFIDGDHNYEGVKKDWDLYRPLLKKNSLVAFHDTGWAEGVNKVIMEDVLPVAQLVEKLPNLQLFKMK